MLQLVDKDTQAFQEIMKAFQLPKESEEDKLKRKIAIQKATKNAILIPLKVMEVSFKSMEVMKAMIEFGNPNSITDAAVGALCARTAVIGAFLNVKINCNDYTDKIYVDRILIKGKKIVEQTQKLEDKLLKITQNKI